MDRSNEFVRVETEGQNHEEEKRQRHEVLTKKPGVSVDSRRLPRDEWAIEGIKKRKGLLT